MSAETFAALCVYTVVMSATPGPNTMLLAASGVNFGFARTIPHMAGIMIGFFMLIALCCAGVGAAIAAEPRLKAALTVAGVLYLLWLSWRIGATRAIGAGVSSGRPMTALEAAAFQFINIKGILFGVTTAAVYIRPEAAWSDSLIVIAVLMAVNVPVAMLWAGFGAAMRGFLNTPERIRAFNIIMAALLILTVIPVLRG